MWFEDLFAHVKLKVIESVYLLNKACVGENPNPDGQKQLEKNCAYLNGETSQRSPFQKGNGPRVH